MGLDFFLYVCDMDETKNKLLAYSNFLEVLGIIEKWQKNAPKENNELTRLAELTLEQLNRHQELMTEVKDLKLMNTLIRAEKNKEILNLKNR